jgi:hypothetical protein
MAKRASSSLLVIAGLISFAGCQERPVVEQLPAANFNGPVVVAPPPPPPEPVKPAPRVAVKPEPKKPAAVTMAVPSEWVPSARANDWRWIVIHHSATPAGGAKAFDKMHKAKGWDELGYHFVVGNGTDTRDGQIEVGPRWVKQKWGAHAKTPDNRFNRYGIGICLVGNFDTERPTRAQLQSLSRLVAYLMKTYHVPADRVIGHGETKATDCPGRNVHIAEIRQMAAAQLAAAGEAVPTGEPAVARFEPGGEMLTAVHPK